MALMGLIKKILINGEELFKLIKVYYLTITSVSHVSVFYVIRGHLVNSLNKTLNNLSLCSITEKKFVPMMF